MKRFLFAIAALTLAASASAQYSCKPSALPNGAGQSGETLVRINSAGMYAAWRCKSNGRLQMAVVRHDFFTPRFVTSMNDFRADPSFQRMNDMLAKYKTGDWQTDPKLREVWIPDQIQINALK